MGGKRKTDHKEMQIKERNHIDSQLSQIQIKLCRESKAGSDTRHCGD